MPETEPFDLTPLRVAAMLGLSANTVKKLAREGHLAGIQLPNRYWRFRRSDVDAFVERMRSGPRAAEAAT